MSGFPEPGRAALSTDDRRRDPEVRALDDHLRGALEQIDEGILVLEIGGGESGTPRIVFCNRATCRLTGFSQEEMLGEPLEILFDPDKLESLIARLPAAADTGRTYKTAGVVLTSTGGKKPCRWTVRGAKSGDRDDLRFTLTFRVEEKSCAPQPSGVASPPNPAPRPPADMTGQSKMESLAFIASGIAHDFNNVLTPIIANLSLAQLDTPPGSALADRVTEAKQAADEARALARQILDFAKGERGRDRRPCDIARLLREAARLATTGANIRCDISAPDDLPRAPADPTQIVQVFNNLLINARQAMPDGGVVQARIGLSALEADNHAALPAGPYLEVTVRDRGCGIPPEDLENVFLAFFTTKNAGSGIGLATCRSIVRAHGGEITVRSKVNVGTEFRVYLPAIDPKTARPARAKNSVVREDADPAFYGGDADDHDAEIIEGEGSVLVVDDQDSIRTVAAAIIGKLGYEAIAAADGEDAVRIYRDRLREGRPVSVVLLDMTLPGGMSGSDTLEELLKLDPKVRTIASSGYFDEAALAAHRASGYVGILPKPYTVERLSQAVHDAITAGAEV